MHIEAQLVQVEFNHFSVVDTKNFIKRRSSKFHMRFESSTFKVFTCSTWSHYFNMWIARWFYVEEGDRKNPTVLLAHGFPSQVRGLGDSCKSFHVRKSYVLVGRLQLKLETREAFV